MSTISSNQMNTCTSCNQIHICTSSCIDGYVTSYDLSVNHYVNCYVQSCHPSLRSSIKLEVIPFIREVLQSGKTFEQVYKELNEQLKTIADYQGDIPINDDDDDDLCESTTYTSDDFDHFNLSKKLKIASCLRNPAYNPTYEQQ